MDSLVQSVRHGELLDENWPAHFACRHVKDEELNPKQLAHIWQGLVADEFAESSIIGTAAVALKLLGKAESQQQAHELGLAYWQGRDKSNYADGISKIAYRKP